MTIMPLIPPSMPWKPLRAAVDAVTVVASASRLAVSMVVDTVPAALAMPAAAIPPPRPQPETLDWVVVCARYGVIEELSDPMTLADARTYQTKIIEAHYGEVSAKIIHKSVSAMLRKGMLSAAILDAMELQLDRGYEILLSSNRRVRF
jgi:hypothetical protein